MSNSQKASGQDRIYLSPPHMSEEDFRLLSDAFHSNWIAPLGPHIDAFEKEFENLMGGGHAVALSSGTAALHLALQVVGVKPGDEVLVSTLTFVASANAVHYCGAKPVFIDSDRTSWNLDPNLVADELRLADQQGRLPSAVLATDVFGQCVDYEAIVDACQKYEIPLIEDAAESLGAEYQGKPAGTLGDIGCFSFNGNKIITTSGGGMLVTKNAHWAERVRHLATQARLPAAHYQHEEIGYNYRLSNLLAAVGRGQLSVLQERVDQRRANYQFYKDSLGKLPGIKFMPELDRGRSTRWLTCVLITPELLGCSAENLRLSLEAENIEARPIWKPMHLQPVYADCRIRGGNVSEEFFKYGLCLPSGSSLTEEDRERVVKVIFATVERSKSKAA
jgi:dTDP-4-amino-4,6-dideoxygalactose transaminase